MATIDIYNEDTEYGGLRMFIQRATTVGGVATIHPTDDGTATGAARFGSIIGAALCGFVNTSTPNQVPLCACRQPSENLKTVEVLVVRGATMVLPILGTTIQFVPDGTEISILLFGTAP